MKELVGRTEKLFVFAFTATLRFETFMMPRILIDQHFQFEVLFGFEILKLYKNWCVSVGERSSYVMFGHFCYVQRMFKICTAKKLFFSQKGFEGKMKTYENINEPKSLYKNVSRRVTSTKIFKSK